MRFSYAFALLFVLSACGDPLAQVERISDVELVEETSAQALPSQEELDREGGFFSRILRRDTDQAEVEAAVSSAEQAVDSGANDASEGAETEVLIEAQPASEPTEIADLGTEAEVAPQANLETQAEQQTPPKKGILGWLQSKAADEDTGSIVASEAVSEIDPAQNAEPATTFDATVTTLNDADGATADLVEPKKRRGLFGLGRTNDAENPETVRTASLRPSLWATHLLNVQSHQSGVVFSQEVLEPHRAVAWILWTFPTELCCHTAKSRVFVMRSASLWGVNLIKHRQGAKGTHCSTVTRMRVDSAHSTSPDLLTDAPASLQHHLLFSGHPQCTNNCAMDVPVPNIRTAPPTKHTKRLNRPFVVWRNANPVAAKSVKWNAIRCLSVPMSVLKATRAGQIF